MAQKVRTTCESLEAIADQLTSLKTIGLVDGFAECPANISSELAIESYVSLYVPSKNPVALRIKATVAEKVAESRQGCLGQNMVPYKATPL